MKLKELVPPALVRMLKRDDRIVRTFSSYQTAASECVALGYQNEGLVELVFKKTQLYRDTLTAKPLLVDETNMRMGLGLSLSLVDNRMSVLDFGGACGAHYFFAKALFGNRIKLQWHVVETNAMAKKGQSLENSELKFYDSLSAAIDGLEKVDLILSSSALPYVVNPYETLETLLDVKGRFIFLARLPLTTGNSDLISVQTTKLSSNGPGPMPEGMMDGISRYPMTVMKKSALELLLSENYETRLHFKELSRAYQWKKESIGMYGYFAELR